MKVALEQSRSFDLLLCIQALYQLDYGRPQIMYVIYALDYPE